jgi:hypothetical protein
MGYLCGFCSLDMKGIALVVLGYDDIMGSPALNVGESRFCIIALAQR